MSTEEMLQEHLERKQEIFSSWSEEEKLKRSYATPNKIIALYKDMVIRNWKLGISLQQLQDNYNFIHPTTIRLWVEHIPRTDYNETVSVDDLTESPQLIRE